MWMEFWSWADDQTVNGSIRGVGADDVDAIVGQVGFARTGVDVGWLIFDDRGLLIPNFTRHNGMSAKRRLLDAERQQARRDKKA